MLRIITFEFLGLFNSEYSLTVTRLINIAEEHNSEALHLKTLQLQLVEIEVQERSDRDGVLLCSLDHECDTLLDVVRYRFRRAALHAGLF